MVMTGNGIAGIGSNVLRAISLVVFQEDPDHPNNLFYSALFNAIFGSVIFCICGICIIFLEKSPYAKYYLSDQARRLSATEVLEA